ncbi:MAG: VWA-like domain-containing protein [Pseudomonadota bacterium]
MSHERHSARAAPALTALTEADPALAALSLWCRHRDGAGPAAQTRGQTITYGPAFSDLRRSEQMGLAAHHILHVALCHSGRGAALAARLGGTFEDDLFNLVADAIVNETVLAGGHVLPRPRVELSGLLATAYGASGPVNLADWDVERLYFKLVEVDASGKARRYGEENGFGHDLQPEASGDDESVSNPADWTARVERALAEGRAAGRGIGRIAGRLGDIPKTDTPWERQLRGLISRVLMARDTRARLRPSRRWLAAEADARAHGRPTPGFDPQMTRLTDAPRIAVLCDASASVPPSLRQRFGGEVAGIAERVGAEVRLIIFDTDLHSDTVLPAFDAPRSLRALAFPDGGGTDFAPAFAAALTPRPSIIVALTDLEAELPPDPGHVPVIWALPGAPTTQPDFGHVVRLDR